MTEINFKQVSEKVDEVKTHIDVFSWPFNRDDVLAEVIVQACQDELHHGLGHPGNMTEDEWASEVATLEGYAQAWLNRWDPKPLWDCIWIWEEMCDRLKKIGPDLWD